MSKIFLVKNRTWKWCWKGFQVFRCFLTRCLTGYNPKPKTESLSPPHPEPESQKLSQTKIMSQNHFFPRVVCYIWVDSEIILCLPIFSACVKHGKRKIIKIGKTYYAETSSLILTWISIQNNWKRKRKIEAQICLLDRKLVTLKSYLFKFSRMVSTGL